MINSVNINQFGGIVPAIQYGQYGDPWGFTSLSDACDTFQLYKNPQLMQQGYNNFDVEHDGAISVGDTVYLNYGATDCQTVPDGIYWLYPNNDNNVPSYFSTETSITLVTTSGGEVTSLDTCTYSGVTIFMYKLYYDYNDGLPIIVGFSNVNDACDATNYMVAYSESSNFVSGATMYYDINLTTPINAIVAYSNPSGQKYYKYEASFASILYTNYVTFEEDYYTVHSVTLCP